MRIHLSLAAILLAASPVRAQIVRVEGQRTLAPIGAAGSQAAFVLSQTPQVQVSKGPALGRPVMMSFAAPVVRPLPALAAPKPEDIPSAPARRDFASAARSVEHIHHDPRRAAELDKLYDGWGWKSESIHSAPLAEAPQTRPARNTYGLAKAPALVRSVRRSGLRVDQAAARARAELRRLASKTPSGELVIAPQAYLEFLKSKTFRDYAAAARASGQRVYALWDQDKTLGSGDIFTFFFAWRAEQDEAHGGFTAEQNKILQDFLYHMVDTKVLAENDLDKAQVARNDGSANAKLILSSWRRQEERERALKWNDYLRATEKNPGLAKLDQEKARAEALPKGIDLLSFWSGAYWPSQKGLTRPQKRRMAQAYARHYKEKIYPDVVAQNKALKAAGVDVVIVSNGDEDLSRAVAKHLGTNRLNVTGSRLVYGADGKATGALTSFELHGVAGAQPGKAKLFQRWQYENQWRGVDLHNWRLASMGGDSAGPDMGPMLYLSPMDVGGFIIDTPQEPWRRLAFTQAAQQEMMGRRGETVVLERRDSASGALSVTFP